MYITRQRQKQKADHIYRQKRIKETSGKQVKTKKDTAIDKEKSSFYLSNYFTSRKIWSHICLKHHYQKQSKRNIENNKE